jgi:uncharacterized membrane protein YkvA (DUF1232 family)
MPPDDHNDPRQPLLPGSGAASAEEAQARPPRRVTFAATPRPPRSSSSSSGSGAAPLDEAENSTAQPQANRSYMQRLKAAVRRLKHETLALYYAAHDPRTPWYARVLPVVAVAYALSPLDLIPDFIPVLGLIDDLLILPALLWLAIKALPPQVLEDSRERARREPLLLHRNWPAAIVFFSLWLLSAELLVAWLLDKYASPELFGDRWAVLAGVAGLGCVAFSAWAVGRLRYDRRRRDAWNLSHSSQQAQGGQQVQQQVQQDVEAGVGGGGAPLLPEAEVPAEEAAWAAGAAGAAAAAGAGDLEEGGAGLPPALMPPPPSSGAAAANGVSHRRVSGDSDEEDESRNNDNGAVAAEAQEEQQPPAASTTTAASPSPGKKRRSKPQPPPLPGSGDDDLVEDRRSLPSGSVNGHAAAAADAAPPVLVPVKARR